MSLPLDRRPVIVALAGPNGAGKTTFYYTHLQYAGLRFVNAALISRELVLEAYAAARIAATIRKQLLEQNESFVFETVFSDPVGDKLALLESAATSGYNVVLCFIGLSGPKVSGRRIAMRTSQGGHDFPTNKIMERYPRIMSNLQKAILNVPNVWIFDNSDLRKPYRLVAVCESGGKRGERRSARGLCQSFLCDCSPDSTAAIFEPQPERGGLIPGEIRPVGLFPVPMLSDTHFFYRSRIFVTSKATDEIA